MTQDPGHQLRLTDDVADLDLDAVHAALSEQAYWALGRPREVTDQAFSTSRVVGALDGDGRTVGFARAVTDGVTFGWLCDVWVDPSHRGHGVGVALVERLVDAPDLANLDRWILTTADAHGLYERFGFRTPERPDLLLQRFRPVSEH